MARESQMCETVASADTSSRNAPRLCIGEPSLSWPAASFCWTARQKYGPGASRRVEIGQSWQTTEWTGGPYTFVGMQTPSVCP